MAGAKRGRHHRKSLAVTVLLLVAAVGLLIFASVGGVRAALSPATTYQAQMDLQNLEVTLWEGDTALADDDTLAMAGLTAGEELIPGKKYTEEITAQNSGNMESYIRVIVYKYWMKDGEKQPDMDPSLINLVTDTDNWVLDATTPERSVLYYKSPVAPGEKIAAPAVTGFKVDSQILQAVYEDRTEDENGYITVTQTYAYDGYEIGLTVVADAVQSHNIEDAAMSAWGVSASSLGLGQ